MMEITVFDIIMNEYNEHMHLNKINYAILTSLNSFTYEY